MRAARVAAYLAAPLAAGVLLVLLGAQWLLDVIEAVDVGESIDVRLEVVR